MDIGSNRDRLMDNMVWFSKNKILIKNKILLWDKARFVNLTKTMKNNHFSL